MAFVEKICCHCLDTLVVPVTLQCQHNVCLSCAEKLILEQIAFDSLVGETDKEAQAKAAAPQKTFHCPVCWEETEYDARRGADSLQRNSHLKGLIATTTNAINEKKCEICETNPVAFENETLGVEICAECEQSLHRGKFKNHRIVDAKLLREQRETTCGEHEKDLDIYCYTCEMSVCILCSTHGSHSRHKCKPLLQAYSNAIEDIEHIIKNKMEYSNQLRKTSQDIDDTVSAMDESYSEAKLNIINYYNFLYLEIEKRKSEFLSSLDQLKEYKLKTLKRQKEELEVHIDHTSCAIENVRNAMQKTSRRDVMGVRSLFQHRLKSTPTIATPVALAETSEFQYHFDKEADIANVQKMGKLEFTPKVTGILFPYKFDFDTNGVLYWIGRNYGMNLNYTNPSAVGLVTVTSSTAFSGNVHNAIAHISSAKKGDTFMSEDVNGSFLDIHIGMQYKLCPTHYSIRNCVINPGHALCNWNFEGSADGDKWVVLRAHRNDTSLPTTRGSVRTYELDCSESFNRFRVIVTGPNQHSQSIAEFHYLVLAGMELYGFLNKI